MSTETLVQQLLKKGVDAEQNQSVLPHYNDLDALAGTWSQQEADEFLTALADFDRVDDSLWQ